MAEAAFHVAVEVEPHHLFRYPSEWDPRTKGAKRSSTKGGYLTGQIHIPKELQGKEVRMHLTTIPDYSIEDEKEVRRLQGGENLVTVHPSTIAVIRKQEVGSRRDERKEPVPNEQHSTQEFLVKREKGFLTLKIKNKTSEKDNGREPIPEEDAMFKIKETDQFLKLGKGKEELNIVILSPKTSGRSGSEDISIDRVIEHRTAGIADESVRKELKSFFSGKKSTNLKKVRLLVEFFSLDGTLLGRGESGGISDTLSKTIGSLDVRDATPLKSCERGGRKVVMVSEFKDWDKSVRPRFLLTDANGETVKATLTQPTEYHNDGKAIYFLTPAQNNIDELIGGGSQLWLLVEREGDRKESLKKFPFTYVKHDSLVFENQCFYCYPGMVDGASQGLPSEQGHTGPNNKRRRMISTTPTPQVETKPL